MVLPVLPLVLDLDAFGSRVFWLKMLVFWDFPEVLQNFLAFLEFVLMVFDLSRGVLWFFWFFFLVQRVFVAAGFWKVLIAPRQRNRLPLKAGTFLLNVTL